jgi:hypothetical protein
MKRLCLILVLLAGTAAGLFAMGKPEEYQSVKGRENWSYSVDVREFKKGKYNLVIKAVDEAGNEDYLGPYNFLVDPDSDLPVINISNPRKEMRIGNSLNIVGTCVDDDAVGKITIQIDDGAIYTGNGKEFWSYYLDVSTLADGPHTITVWGTDINGLEGKKVSTSFNLDKTNPVNTVTSHSSGVLVTGKVEFQGEITDPNGIGDLVYSDDGGKTWKKLKFDYDKKTLLAQFKLGIDTKDMIDGPYVYWLRSTDLTGSVGTTPFLFFVDNLGPELSFLFPTPESVPQNGKLTVIGRVNDSIGVKVFTYTHSRQKEPAEIVLTPGNPYFVQEFDFTGESGNSVEILFRLEDLTGNVVEKKYTVKMDQNKDLPTVAITWPAANYIADTTLTCTGFIRDDDAPAFVEYSLDGGAFERIAATDIWAITLKDLVPGAHKLAVQGVDVNEVTGPRKEVSFRVAAPAPILAANSFTVGEVVEEWVPGRSVDPALGGSINGTVYSVDKTLTLSVIFQNDAPVKVSMKPSAADPNLRTFSFPVKKKLPAGRYNIIMEAVDSYGQTSRLGTAFYVMPADGSDPGDGEGVYYLHPHVTDSGLYIVNSDMLLTGWVRGGDITGVTLEPAAAGLKTSFAGGTFSVSATDQGLYRDVVVAVTVSGGKTFRTGKLTISTDSTRPVFSAVEPAAGAWLQNNLPLKGTLTDRSGIRLVEYSLDGQNFNKLNQTDGAGSARFDQALALTGIEEGMVGVVIRAVDYSGNVSMYGLPVYKDMTPPQLTLVAPLAEDVIYRKSTVFALVTDAGRIKSLSFAAKGIADSPLVVGNTTVYQLDLAAWKTLPGEYGFKAVDMSGNTFGIPVALNVNIEANKPIVQIQTPSDGGFIKSDFTISGMVFDPDGIKAIYYSLDGGEFRKIGEGNSFNIPIKLDEIADDKHKVSIRAEDTNGTMSDTVTAAFTVSKEEPKTRILFPIVENTVTGTIKFQGESTDANGIKAVYVSVDNGNTYHQAQGAEKWTYWLNSRILKDGTYSVLVRAVDNTDTEGLFVTLLNVDNTAPRVRLDYPLDGDILKEKVEVKGTGSDNIKLTALKMIMIPVDGSGKPGASAFEYNLPDIGVFSETVDILSVPNGKYILRVEGRDAAGNIHFASRSVVVDHKYSFAQMELFYPLAGETVNFIVPVAGKYSGVKLESARLYIDGEPFGVLTLDSNGYFRRDLLPEEIKQGAHKIKVVGKLLDGKLVETEEREVFYSPFGGWVSVASVNPGTFISGRPFLKGTAGYNMEPLAPELLGDKDAVKDYERKSSGMKPVLIEVSLNNGRTFQKASGTKEWKFRLQTQDMKEGETRIIIRATFPDGEIYTRTMVNLDKTTPDLTLLQQFQDGRFNDDLTVMGLASDNNGVETVTAAVREGDKAMYEVPGFIQGLYIDAHALGVTYGDLGIGLTFFDDNVKLQAQVGWAPGEVLDASGELSPSRFSGLVIGAKLLANIVKLPFSFFFGPDWEMFSASVALGTNFSYFTMSGSEIAFTDDGKIVAAVLAQVEIPKFTFKNNKFLRYVSLYGEAQLWFIPSDVEAGVSFKPTLGVRIGLF